MIDNGYPLDNVHTVSPGACNVRDLPVDVVQTYCAMQAVANQYSYDDWTIGAGVVKHGDLVRYGKLWAKLARQCAAHGLDHANTVARLSLSDVC